MMKERMTVGVSYADGSERESEGLEPGDRRNV